MTKREKIIVFGGWILIVALILFFTPRKLNNWTTCSLIILITLLFYFISKIEKIFKYFNWEYRLDGDLKLKHKKAFGIVQCLNCSMHTISWVHLTKSIQTCSECSKKYKAIISTPRKIVSYLLILTPIGLFIRSFFFPAINHVPLLFLIFLGAAIFINIPGKIEEVQ